MLHRVPGQALAKVLPLVQQGTHLVASLQVQEEQNFFSQHSSSVEPCSAASQETLCWSWSMDASQCHRLAYVLLLAQPVVWKSEHHMFIVTYSPKVTWYRNPTRKSSSQPNPFLEVPFTSPIRHVPDQVSFEGSLCCMCRKSTWSLEAKHHPMLTLPEHQQHSEKKLIFQFYPIFRGAMWVARELVVCLGRIIR